MKPAGNTAARTGCDGSAPSRHDIGNTDLPFEALQSTYTFFQNRLDSQLCRTLARTREPVMRRLSGLARRLSVAMKQRIITVEEQFAGRSATAVGSPSARRCAATGTTAAAGLLAAFTQSSLADAPQKQGHEQQAQQGDDGAACPDCGEVQLEDQPAAVSNSATAQVLWGPSMRLCTAVRPACNAWAEGDGKLVFSRCPQWRVFTDLGRELVQQGRLSEAERYFKKVPLCCSALAVLEDTSLTMACRDAAACLLRSRVWLPCLAATRASPQLSCLPLCTTQAVEMAREGFGADDPHVASACNNLAEFYRLRRRYDEAEPLYQQVPGAGWLCGTQPGLGLQLHSAPGPAQPPGLAHMCCAAAAVMAQVITPPVHPLWHPPTPAPSGAGHSDPGVRAARRTRRLCSAQPGWLLPRPPPAGARRRLLRAGAAAQAGGAGHGAQVWRVLVRGQEGAAGRLRWGACGLEWCAQG